MSRPNHNSFWQLMSLKLSKMKKVEEIGDAHISKLQLIKILKWSTKCSDQKFFSSRGNFWHLVLLTAACAIWRALPSSVQQRKITAVRPTDEGLAFLCIIGGTIEGPSETSLIITALSYWEIYEGPSIKLLLCRETVGSLTRYFHNFIPLANSNYLIKLNFIILLILKTIYFHADI